MTGADPLWLAMGFAVAGLVVLRYSWGRAKRSDTLNLAGWTSLAAAVLVAGRAAGAWGVAVVILATTGAAFVALAVDAARPVSARRRAMPQTYHRGKSQPGRRMGSRLLTFALAGPIALVASLLIALAVRALILAGGGAEADGNVAVLATLPLAWPILTYSLLMMSNRRAQLVWTVGLAALSIPFLLLTGGIA